ncbi:DUF2076 domain-containing protein [Buchnera aphidicola (Pemphigus obesinymphae)]|uniref:DUF2076 domain-containing protein n=1 Tax=Buchnera aphidicola TaxID=9 RepID=UPI00223913F6|nr:DUF2076 domain-containing protein [Buchnera aphidicola]MCW5196636.1 DUF2076 domain-containing protein [Buchnera aphidicola (Pemphigus obesinymphae)]
MEQKEKILIENLFNRLENVEKKSSVRDVSAEKLIQELLMKQQNAPYYMTQIILVQEEAIKKLNEHINQLESEVSLMKEKENKNNSTSFLSGLFGSSNVASSPNNIKNAWGNTSGKLDYNSLPINNVPTGNITTPGSSGNVGSFLGSALQTATGVAGGMIMGNMLMNLFQHKNSGEDFLNDVNISSEKKIDSNIDNHDVNNHYIDNNNSNIHENIDNDIISVNDDTMDTDIDVSDDSSFI